MFENYSFTVGERFIRYVQIDTQSDPGSKSTPSTEKQKDLGRLLVKELQDMGGVDVILSFSPSMKQNSQSIQGLRAGGRFVTTAVSREPIQADPVSMLFKQTSIIGSAHNDPGDIVDILNLVAAGKVKLWLETYPIEDLNRVLTRLEEGKVRHRAVVVQA